MNNIYVDELPKCCLVCKLGCPEEQRCVDGFTMDCDYCSVNERPTTCPLKPLSVALAEERKKVVSEIRDIARKIARPTTEYDDKTFDYDIDAIEFDNLLLWFQNGKQDFVKTYLDQIERGE